MLTKIAVRSFLFVMILLGCALPGPLRAARESGEARAAKLLRGDLWHQMSQDQKVAFIWGMAQVVVIEQALMVRNPSLRVENFSAKVVEGMAGMPMNDIVREVDEFYAQHPDKTELPVARVIWDELVRPNLKTGIAGRPLSGQSHGG
jgi:hypothetical protein